jgi:hypothetical protein
MAEALIVSAGDAIVEAINEHEWGIEFSAARSYADWADELKVENVLHVDVVPLQTAYAKSELASRGKVKHRLGFDIAVRKKFGRQDQNVENRVERAKLDSLVYLTEALHHFFVAGRLSGFEAAVWQSSDIVLTYSRKHLREYRQFLSIVRLMFEGSRTL